MSISNPLPIVSPTVTPASRPVVNPPVRPSARPAARPVVNPVVRPLGEQSLPRTFAKLDRRGGYTPQAKYIDLDNVPIVNGKPQTVLPHMPAGYVYH